MKPDCHEATKARFRMAFWLMLFYIITLVEGYLTFPFVGHTTQCQNVIHGIMVGIPFWMGILIFLVLTRRELSSKHGSTRNS